MRPSGALMAEPVLLAAHGPIPALQRVLATFGQLAIADPQKGRNAKVLLDDLLAALAAPDAESEAPLRAMVMLLAADLPGLRAARDAVEFIRTHQEIRQQFDTWRNAT